MSRTKKRRPQPGAACGVRNASYRCRLPHGHRGDHEAIYNVLGRDRTVRYVSGWSSVRPVTTQH